MAENGVKFQWISTILAGALAGMLGWFWSSMQADKTYNQSDKANYLTLREYESYVKGIDIQLKEIHDRVKDINDRVIAIESKLSNFPTRDEINAWIRRDLNKDGAEKAGTLKK